MPAAVGAAPTPVLAMTATAAEACGICGLGNYGESRAQVHAQLVDAAEAVLSTVRIGPAVTIAGQGLGFRTRFSTVPAGTTQVMVSVLFSGGGANDSSRERTASRSF